MKRQRGRNRKPGGGTGGGGGNQNNPNRAFESNGPDGVKIRGNSQHVYERYHQLARDAFSSGDRVLAENYLQHAEHYFRVLRTLQPQRPLSEIAARDAFTSGFDIDFEDESGAQAENMDMDGVAESGDSAEGGDQQNGQGDQQWRRDENRGNRDDNRGARDYRQGEQQPRDRDRDRDYRRDEGSQGQNRDRDNRDRDNRDNQPRDSQPRDNQSRDGPPYREPRGEGEGRPGRRERFERRDRRPRDEQPANTDPLAVVQPRGAALPERSEPAPDLRNDDAGESQLPAFLRQATPVAPASSAAETEKPKRAPRRKKPASFEDGDASERAEEEA